MELTSVPVKTEASLLAARDATRRACAALGFTHINQVRITTAVSEITRNIYEYAGTGTMSLHLEQRGNQRGLKIVASDHGPGIPEIDRILAGTYVSSTGMGLGLRGSKALMDEFEVVTQPRQGTRVTMIMWLPQSPGSIDLESLRAAVAAQASPNDVLLQELQAQNRELLQLLQELSAARELQDKTNEELRTTNLGIVMLNAELEDRANRLLQSETALRARNEELKAFAYTVSHDLKAPLRGIVGYAQELERRHQDGLSERGRFCVGQIRTAGQNLDCLINDLLRYSRLDAETPALTDVNVTALVASILKDRSLAIAERGVEVSVTIAFATAHLWERALRQILTNLIDNALKYSRRSTPSRVSIGGQELPDGWRLSIEDNGIGFDMKYHDRIFGLFNRLTQEAEFEGTGAGLAIVKKLVERQGGRIWAESLLGEGSTFFVELPRQERPGAA